MTNTGDVEIVGSTETTISSLVEGMEMVRVGMGRRVTGGTKMNVHSSRSHALVGVKVMQRCSTTEVVERERNDEKAGGGEGENEDWLGASDKKYRLDLSTNATLARRRGRQN
jgi:hypothetical protein